MTYIQTTIKCEKRRAQRFEDTLSFLERFLPAHVGESFTCADLKALCPGEYFDSHIAAYWMSKNSFFLGVKIDIEKITKIYNPPIVVHDDWNGTDITITEKQVNLYTITGLREQTDYEEMEDDDE